MIIKNKIRKSFFDILSPPVCIDRGNTQLLNVPINIISNVYHKYNKKELQFLFINVNIISVNT